MYSLFEKSLQKDAFFGCPNLSSANQTVLHCRSPKMKLLQRIHSPNEKWELEFKLLHKSNCYQQLLNAKSFNDFCLFHAIGGIIKIWFIWWGQLDLNLPSLEPFLYPSKKWFQIFHRIRLDHVCEEYWSES